MLRRGGDFGVYLEKRSRPRVISTPRPLLPAYFTFPNAVHQFLRDQKPYKRSSMVNMRENNRKDGHVLCLPIPRNGHVFEFGKASRVFRCLWPGYRGAGIRPSRRCGDPRNFTPRLLFIYEKSNLGLQMIVCPAPRLYTIKRTTRGQFSLFLRAFSS
jgi:hypothetical protein